MILRSRLCPSRPVGIRSRARVRPLDCGPRSACNTAQTPAVWPGEPARWLMAHRCQDTAERAANTSTSLDTGHASSTAVLWAVWRLQSAPVFATFSCVSSSLTIGAARGTTPCSFCSDRRWAMTYSVLCSPEMQPSPLSATADSQHHAEHRADDALDEEYALTARAPDTNQAVLAPSRCGHPHAREDSDSVLYPHTSCDLAAAGFTARSR